MRASELSSTSALPNSAGLDATRQGRGDIHLDAVATKGQRVTSDEVPTQVIFAEDLAEGMTIDLGSYTLSRAAIVAFARTWDPHPIHVDENAASESHFGEVVASGVHSLAVFQRLAVLGAFRHWSIVAGRSLRDVAFLRPVRPGMELAGSLVVEAVTETHADRALVTLQGELTNSGQSVLSLTLESYVRLRCSHTATSASPRSP